MSGCMVIFSTTYPKNMEHDRYWSCLNSHILATIKLKIQFQYFHLCRNRWLRMIYCELLHVIGVLLRFGLWSPGTVTSASELSMIDFFRMMISKWSRKLEWIARQQQQHQHWHLNLKATVTAQILEKFCWSRVLYDHFAALKSFIIWPTLKLWIGFSQIILNWKGNSPGEWGDTLSAIQHSYVNTYKLI